MLVSINVFLTFIGFLSVKKMLKRTAADFLRPYIPKAMRHLALEETKAFKALDFGTKWNLRDCLRHKSRSCMTLFGIVGCMLLLVGGLGMRDTMNAFVEVFYNQAIHYETRMNLDAESTTNAQAQEIADQYAGDWCASASVQIGDRGFGLEIYSVTHDKVRFPDADMRFITLSDDGAYICARIARKFDLRAGDSLTFFPYDSDRKYTIRVADILSSMSESVVMTAAYAVETGIDYAINTVFTDEQDIAASDHILNTQTKQAIMDSFDTFTDLMNTMIILLAVAAVVLGIVMLYNLGIMSYAERYREMATLKVVGFKNARIARLLISQNLWLTVLGILIGLPAGVGVLQYLLNALASEYELKLALGLPAYLMSIVVSLIVGLMVPRKNRHIDMVAALKTEE